MPMRLAVEAQRFVKSTLRPRATPSTLGGEPNANEARSRRADRYCKIPFDYGLRPPLREEASRK